MLEDIKIVGAGGEYMDAVVLMEWLVQPGDAVVGGDIVAVVETAKASTEVEAPTDGVLAEVLAKVGDEIEVGSVIGRVSTGEKKSNPVTPKIKQSESVQVDNFANLKGDETPELVQLKKDRVVASPLARRVAEDLNVDLFKVNGTGPKGRINRKDVECAHEEVQFGKEMSRDIIPHPSDQPIGNVVANLFEANSFELLPHDGMRRTIARRLVEAKTTIPHFYLKASCNLDNLLQLRLELNDKAVKESDGIPNFKISINDFIIKAHAKALNEVTDANVTWTEEGLLVHKSVDVAVAIAIPGGLVTPVIRGAEKKSISAISSTIKEFAQRAQDRQLTADEYQGGTSTVSNLGMYGVEEFSAIINPPHATILAVGASRQEAVVIFDAVSTLTKMTVTLSVDHRAVDGALGAELLQAFKRNIEAPLTLLV